VTAGVPLLLTLIPDALAAVKVPTLECTLMTTVRVPTSVPKAALNALAGNKI
jgi:hypothetical protein